MLFVLLCYSQSSLGYASTLKMLYSLYRSLNELGHDRNIGLQPTARSGGHKNTWVFISCSHDQSPDGVSLIISPQFVSWEIIPCKRRNSNAKDISRK